MRKAKAKAPEGLLFSSAALKALLVPLIIEQILIMTVGMADGVMVSAAGEAALSGVSLVDMLNIVLANIFSALATGGAVVTSRYLGAKNREAACQSALQLLLAAAAVSLMVTVLALGLKRQALTLFFGSISPDVMESALAYFTLTALSYPFLALYSAACALFRSMGNSKITMKISLLMNLINIVGNAILILGCGLGAAGAALATLIARLAACLLSLCLLTDRRGAVFLSREQSLRPNLPMIRQILKIGIPSGLETSFFHLGKVLVLSVISAFGTVQLAANAAANTLAHISCIPGTAIGLAMITLVGQCVGAGRLEQAVYYVKKLMRLTYQLLFGISAALLLLLPLALRLYQLSPETARLAALLVWIHVGFAVVFWPPAFTLPNALRAAGDVTFTMSAAVFSMLAVRIAGGYILGLWLGWGAVGVWLAMIGDWIVRDLFFVGRMLRGSWRKKALGPPA